MTKLGIQPRVTWFGGAVEHWCRPGPSLLQNYVSWGTQRLSSSENSIHSGVLTLRFLMAQFNLFSWKLFHLRVMANENRKKSFKKWNTESLVSVALTKLNTTEEAGAAGCAIAGPLSHQCDTGQVLQPIVPGREGKAWLITPKSQTPHVSSTCTSAGSLLTLKHAIFSSRVWLLTPGMQMSKPGSIQGKDNDAEP